MPDRRASHQLGPRPPAAASGAAASGSTGSTDRAASTARPRRGISWWWLPAALAVAVQLWGIYRPEPPPSVPGVPQLDKLAHLISFGAPAVLVSLAIDRTRLRRATGRPRPRRTVLVVAVVLAGHAVLSEIIQARFYTRRSGDPLDLVADLVGLTVGAMVAGILLRPRRHGRGTDGE